MPLINPEDVIKSSFKDYNRQRKEKARLRKKDLTNAPNDEPPVVHILDVPGQLDNPDLKLVSHPESHFEELLRKESSKSAFFSMQSDMSHGAESVSSGASIYIVEETPVKTDDEKNEKNPSKAGSSIIVPTKINDAESENDEKRSKKAHLYKKRINDEDRRRNTWIPCTCPQYKVSHELASKRDVQAIFFAKVMLIKVVQLLVINIVIFASGLQREKTIEFYKCSHDWAYLAYGFFLALLLCIRITLSYRARWPRFAAFILMVPLTAIVAFVSACITVVYNSVLIPMVTCTVFLTFLMLCFMPYLLRKFVMHRTTNCAASALALLSSIGLLFLKEMETKPLSYWDFVSHVWLPGLLLSQIVVQITVFEIQRILFGLCFNVSSSRWHIAALYL